MINAWGIFSGGLDSLLAAKLVLDQGLKVRLVTFVSPFFGPEKARSMAKLLAIEPILLDLTDRLIPFLTEAPHGHGRWLNPCIDCHALMFSEAGRLLRESGEPGFLFSGEVLGQRPMSQNLKSLMTVASASGMPELIVRPLSAKALPPSKPELEGLLDRERLLGLTGRGRSAQIALAAAYGFQGYPTPAGGCLLTDNGYTARARRLIDRAASGGFQALNRHNLEFLKYGRLFELPVGGALVLVGRKEAENLALMNLAGPDDLLLGPAERPGPVVAVPDFFKREEPEIWNLAAELCASYVKPESGGGLSAHVSAALVRELNNPSLAAQAVYFRDKTELAAFMV